MASVDAESFLTSRSDGWRAQVGCGCSGNKSCFHRNFGPLNHRLLCSNSFAVKRWEASSAGFSFPGMLYAVANVHMKPARVVIDVSNYDLRVGVVIALDVIDI